MSREMYHAAGPRPATARPLDTPPLKPGREAPAELLARRAMALPGHGYPPPPSVVTQEIELGPLRCLSCSAPDAHGVLFHIHGGGFRGGNPSRSQPFAETVAARLGCTVILPGYPLAPENPFPAALLNLRDAFAAIDTSQPLVIGGDSAGGNLALGLWQLGAAADALWLLSPWLDLRVTAQAYDRAATTDQLFSREMALDAREMYLQGHSPEDPLASPLLGTLDGLPETFVLAGGVEVLLDDSLRLVSQLAAAGVDVECRIIPDMQHVAPTLGPDWPGSLAGLDASIRFLERQFAHR